MLIFGKYDAGVCFFKSTQTTYSLHSESNVSKGERKNTLFTRYSQFYTILSVGLRNMFADKLNAAHIGFAATIIKSVPVWYRTVSQHKIFISTLHGFESYNSNTGRPHTADSHGSIALPVRFSAPLPHYTCILSKILFVVNRLSTTENSVKYNTNRLASSKAIRLLGRIPTASHGYLCV